MANPVSEGFVFGALAPDVLLLVVPQNGFSPVGFTSGADGFGAEEESSSLVAEGVVVSAAVAEDGGSGSCFHRISALFWLIRS